MSNPRAAADITIVVIHPRMFKSLPSVRLPITWDGNKHYENEQRGSWKAVDHRSPEKRFDGVYAYEVKYSVNA